MAKTQIVRRRERIRQKRQEVDPTARLDLSEWELALPPRTRAGRRLWARIVESPPYWWNMADVFMAELLVTAEDNVAISMQPGAASPTSRATAIKEFRMVAAELGLSPTSRGRLKLTEAKGAVAARRANELGNSHDDGHDAIDVDELT